MRAKSQPRLLSRSSPEPLYRQIANQLESDIRGGRIEPGHRLESEAALGQQFSVSRITLRQAIAELVRKQLVVRKQGKGTFVTAPAVRHDLKHLHGLLGSLFSQAVTASTKLLRYELRVPPADAIGSPNLPPGEPALCLDRLYLIAGTPVALAQARLVPEVAALARDKAALISTEDMMRDVGIRVASSQVAICAEAAGAVVGRLLKISPRAPVLVLRRTTFGDDRRIKEVGRISFCSDGYELVCSTYGLNPAQSLFDIRNVEEQV